MFFARIFVLLSLSFQVSFVWATDEASEALREVMRGSSSGGFVIDDGSGSFGKPKSPKVSSPSDDDIGGDVESPKGGLSKVCPKVRAVGRLEVWKSIASDEFSNSDPRKRSTSFIVRLGGTRPSTSCLNVYDKSGASIHRLGIYQPAGNYAARYYGGWGCGDKQSAGSVASRASAKTKSPEVFVKVNSRTCVRIPNANRCVNSTAC